VGKTIKVRSAKNKGMRFQKYVCEKISDVFGIEYDQQDDNCLIHSRECGLSGTDVILRGEIYNAFPYDIECKNTQTISVYSYIRQAEANTKEGRNWLIFHKKNHTKPIVIMDAEHFFELFKEAKKL
jgi:hypothetical protein